MGDEFDPQPYFKESRMNDPRVDRMAKVLVHYSNHIEKGDRVLIEAEPQAAPLVRACFREVLLAGGHPHTFISLDGQTTLTGIDDIFLQYAGDEQLDFPATFYDLAYQQFESRIRIHSVSNSKLLMGADKAKLARRSKVMGAVTKVQFQRGAAKEFKWMTTLFPTNAYAQDTGMSLDEFEHFVFSACHVDDPDEDAVAYWLGVKAEQVKIVERLNGHDRVEVKSPDCELNFSIKDRTFKSAHGENNMPDGEVFTGPVEGSVEGRVRFSFPAVLQGNEVEGVELIFKDGQVIEATAKRNQAFLDAKLNTDEGARYLGEFAIGLNYGVKDFSKNILFDEKFGGTIHMALGAGYPDTGSKNVSAIHWDMVCDMRQDAEIRVDGELFYQDGKVVN
jgi:aminopeptidase